MQSLTAGAQSHRSVVPRQSELLQEHRQIAEPKRLNLSHNRLQLLDELSDACRRQHLPLDTASTLHQVARIEEIQSQLEEVFLSKGGYRIAASERRQIEATGGSAAYGELGTHELPKLLGYLGMDQSSVFFDLGSGTGSIVLATALGNAVRKAVGVELSGSRHEQAEAALQVVDGLGLPHSRVELRNEDIAAVDIADGTHFYLCSTAFSASLCRKVAERLSQSRHFQVLITSRELPFQPYLRKLGDFACDYSWVANSSAFVYVKSLQAAPAQLLARFLSMDGICYLPPAHFLPTVQEGQDARSMQMGGLSQFARASPAIRSP